MNSEPVTQNTEFNFPLGPWDICLLVHQKVLQNHLLFFNSLANQPKDDISKRTNLVVAKEFLAVLSVPVTIQPKHDWLKED